MSSRRGYGLGCRRFFLAALLLLSLPVSGDQSYAGDSATAVSVKAHLLDGSVVLFPDGLRISHEESQILIRAGAKSLAASAVRALEYYDDRLMRDALRRGAVPGGGAPIEALQSSPALYAFDGANYVLEGEAFSSNILAAAEADDLDRLDAGVVVDGVYRLRVCNHAWETQYINSIGLRAVDHAPDREAFPTRERDVVVVGSMRPVGEVFSKEGREVSAVLSRRDNEAYRTPLALLDELTQRPSRDWLEFKVPIPSDASELYVAMRVRNTLFNNVLLEHALLNGRGPKTMDLLGGERFRLFEMWRLYRWVRKYMGLRVLVANGDRFHVADRIGGTGPAAWRQLVSRVRVRPGGSARIRLEFLADSWSIDWIALSFEGNDEVTLRSMPLVRLQAPPGPERSLVRLEDNDKLYLSLYPGEMLDAAFRVDLPKAGLARTYFAETQGYFLRWLGPEHFIGASTAFHPDDASLFQAARHWIDDKAAIEAGFRKPRCGKDPDWKR